MNNQKKAVLKGAHKFSAIAIY